MKCGPIRSKPRMSHFRNTLLPLRGQSAKILCRESAAKKSYLSSENGLWNRPLIHGEKGGVPPFPLLYFVFLSFTEDHPE